MFANIGNGSAERGGAVLSSTPQRPEMSLASRIRQRETGGDFGRAGGPARFKRHCARERFSGFQVRATTTRHPQPCGTPHHTTRILRAGSPLDLGLRHNISHVCVRVRSTDWQLTQSHDTHDPDAANLVRAVLFQHASTPSTTCPSRCPAQSPYAHKQMQRHTRPPHLRLRNCLSYGAVRRS